MSQPIYFLPLVSAGQVIDPTTELLRKPVLAAHGLNVIFGDVRTKAECSVFDCPKGPGGQSGTLLTYLTTKGDVPDRLGYYAEHQEWEQIGKAWIGYDREHPPTEADLRRKRQVGGYKIEMEDGSSWVVPIIRRPDDSTELPCDMFYGADGALKEPVKEAYREYWEATAEVASWFFNDSGEFGGDTFSKTKAFDLAVKALSINYRFGHAEQRICRAISSENMLAVLMSTVDYQSYRLVSEAAKKNSSPPDVVITTHGPLADSATIDLPAQTSGSVL